MPAGGARTRRGQADRLGFAHATDDRREAVDRADAVIIGLPGMLHAAVAGRAIARKKPLAARGYAGWLVVEAEQDPARAHPLTYARKGYAWLVQAARAAGFEVRTRDAP